MLSTASARERFLLVVTILGFVIPNAMVIAFMVDNGLAIADYFAAWTETLPGTQLLVDLGICCLAFIGWASWDGPRSGVRNWWWVLPATFLVGLCFGIPLYLLMRERAVRLSAAPRPAAAA